MSTRFKLIIALVVGIANAFASIVVVLVVGFVALLLGFLRTVTTVVAAFCRGVVKIVSLPFRPCIGNRDPISPLGISHDISDSDSPGVGGVVDGQIRYVRETQPTQPDGRPPSYHSDDEVGTSQTVK
jgi:hypothetical protein